MLLSFELDLLEPGMSLLSLSLSLFRFHPPCCVSVDPSRARASFIGLFVRPPVFDVAVRVFIAPTKVGIVVLSKDSSSTFAWPPTFVCTTVRWLGYIALNV